MFVTTQMFYELILHQFQSFESRTANFGIVMTLRHRRLLFLREKTLKNTLITLESRKTF
jgi:hypothetical protein